MKVTRGRIIVAVSVVVVVVAVVLVVRDLSAAAARRHAAAQINQVHAAEITMQHNQQLGWEARLPEVYAVTVVPGGGKAAAAVFSYSLTKGVQTYGKEAVVAEQIGGQIVADQADSGIMPDAFKCQWIMPCDALAKDSAGDTIYASAEPNSFYYYYGLTRGKSVLRITARKSLAKSDVIAVVNSLTLASQDERKHLKVDLAK